ncbi:uncharacterized protein F4812DRAFT_461193 [Daldinia caldariorum]|uniref:uncharacterized protein n=1 Tax=Daldinia caldariorum TaxID=326644 RepID=UPI002008C390|nr:uncharacterized protein F4812DRAFT_461193 [Daldinia caldariorum]KAI1466222.1 hypothetical protein F4812DRAFT_461193 [Daldinia caldariorum]
MHHEGLRDTQFVKNYPEDRERARGLEWDSKLLDFEILESSPPMTFEAVLDSLAGFTKYSEACAHFQKLAEAEGVKFYFGQEEGRLNSLREGSLPNSTHKRAIELGTKDGAAQKADILAIAYEEMIYCRLLQCFRFNSCHIAGSFSTLLLQDLSYQFESSGGSVVTFKIYQFIYREMCL